MRIDAGRRWRQLLLPGQVSVCAFSRTRSVFLFVMDPERTAEPIVVDAQAIFQAGVERVQAPRIFSRSDLLSKEGLRTHTEEKVLVLGMGKAAMAMAGVVETHLEAYSVEGTVIVPEGYPASYPGDVPRPSEVEVVEGGHPLPSLGSLRGARKLMRHAEDAEEGTEVLVLASGGGTALSTLPVESLDLGDLKSTYHKLMTAGVEIHGANAVRKHLTQVGGGQLARAAHPAQVRALVVSDVVGDDLTAIASGPTVPDPTTYEEAVRVLYTNGLWHDVPEPVRTYLAEGARGRHPETPKPGDSCFEAVETSLVGTNRDALEAARGEAEDRGYRVRRVTPGVEGEAREVGRAHAQLMIEECPEEPTCWIWGGETTVTVTGSGRGGRNQEVALGAALSLEGECTDAVLLSGGTDGIDGPTDAAGGWATPSTVSAAQAAGHDPEAALADNNAYPLFEAIDQLLRPGPTHTNVMDVQVGLVRPE